MTKPNDLQSLKRQYIKAKNAYYNKSPVMTDAAFDRLEDQIRKSDPEWAELGKTGTAVASKKTEVKLREFMPSLNKSYPEAMGKWVAKTRSPHFVVMDKLDGSSLQVVYERGRLVQVVTRGDGTLGGDITFLAKHLNLPLTIKAKATTIFRCEAIMPKDVFADRWASEFDNGRNMVNGLLNRKTPHKALADVHIVVLGCYGLTIRAGLQLSRAEGLTVVRTGRDLSREQCADPDGMTKLLDARRKNSDYEMDGLVVVPHDFMFDYTSADKPKNATAFKVNSDDDAVEVEVKSIVWQVSGRGRIIPKIEIAPTKMDGVVVTYCTSHNAVWMRDRKIGPGAVVKLVRSGGVIPKIVDVVKPAKKLQLPTIDYTVSGVHFVVAASTIDRATRKKMEVEQISKFMKTMGIEFLAAKTIAKAHSGGLSSVERYVELWGSSQLVTALTWSAGLGDGMSTKIGAEFDRVFGSRVSMLDLMVASQCFGIGIGSRKLKQLEAAEISMAWLSRASVSQIKRRLATVSGFSDKTIQLITDGIPAWHDFLARIEPHVSMSGKLPAKKAAKVGSLTGKTFSFTGYRDADHEARITDAGGSIVPFGSKTQILLVKAGGKASSKVDKARSSGITVSSFADLKL